MRIAHHTAGFRRDYRKMKQSKGENIYKLRAVMDQLMDGAVLPQKSRDHTLHGEGHGCRDCHIEGDWVLVYEFGVDVEGRETITFHATGNHEYLFG